MGVKYVFVLQFRLERSFFFFVNANVELVILTRLNLYETAENEKNIFENRMQFWKIHFR